MARVFLSYRHENDAHRERVRRLGERLRAKGVEVLLDQFLLDQEKGGPENGWSTWSLQKARHTEKVLIIASAGWFHCYEGTEVPSAGLDPSAKGLGTAAEARVIKQRLYNARQVNWFARIVVFDPADAQNIPLDLQPFHRFDPECDLTAMISWITGAAPGALSSPPASEWPATPQAFDWEPADCEPVREAFTRLLTAGTPHRVLLIGGESETGKTFLTRHLLALALDCAWLACGRFDLKSGADLDGEFARFVLSLGVDEAVNKTPGQPLRARLDAVLDALRKRGHPTLLLFDTFEQGGDLARWVEETTLLAVPRAQSLRVIIAGQQLPKRAGAPWTRFAAVPIELQQLGWRPWFEFGSRRHNSLTEDLARQIHELVRGKHGLLSQLFGPHPRS